MDAPQTPSQKLDVYQMVTDRIIELLSAGTIPWKQPWTDSGVPMNLISKRPYRGINLWLLLSLQYERNLFLTWDQLKKMGASVKQGEHGHIVVFWKQVKKQPEVLDDKEQPKTVPMLRYYKVFNIAQCRDIPNDMLPELVADDGDPLAECEAIVQAMPDCPVIQHKEQKAYYSIEGDFINMPKKKSFKTQSSYYCTLFHELVHSTGSEKRLGRSSVTDMSEFGSDSYSLEELIAEMGASFLNSFAGILDTQIKDSAAYIKGWLSVLKNDKRFIIAASGQAQVAVDFILNRKEQVPNEEIAEVQEASVVR
ncbi:MAG: DUF1738 domain-containing protein [Bacteroidetes bacterium]|nr:DUF1738 domain-containing protein [Bacteroidota bacterium]